MVAVHNSGMRLDSRFAVRRHVDLRRQASALCTAPVS
ncbi:MAG: putative leader peptide [Pseudonocardia sediminis]